MSELLYEGQDYAADQIQADADRIRRSMVRRIRLIDRLNKHPEQRPGMVAYWSQDIIAYCNDLCWTYDPRLVPRGLPAYVPFDLFPRQVDYLLWLEEQVATGEEFVVEKSRDVGLTWLNCVFASHKWLYTDGFKTTFGANKEDNVDRIGVVDTIFEKMRLLLSRMPVWLMPWYVPRKHATFMRFVNPLNENTITGESGDNMGRGGRSTLYLVDEAAHVERAKRVDAAIIAVADSRGWISSVYGDGGLFAEKRHSGRIPVFTFHFRDDPRKDAAWEKKKRATTDEAVFAQEYDIDYSASVAGLFIPAKHVRAARALSKLVEYNADGYQGMAGLDVGGGGSGKSIYVERFGPFVHVPVDLGKLDSIDAAHEALELAKKGQVYELKYDSVGVGVGVAAVFKRVEGVRTAGVNVGLPASLAKWPDGVVARRKFLNMKAELWGVVASRLEKSYKLWLHMTGQDGGEPFDVDECLILPLDEGANQMCRELSLPKKERLESGKVQVERKEALSRRGIASPDWAEALILSFAPEKQHRPMGQGMKVITG